MSKYYRVKTLMLKGQKGDTGYSITDIHMNDDYTLTITIENGMHFNTPPIRGEKGEQGTGIRSVELRDDYSLLITLEDGKTLETTAILGKEFENIRKLEASASSASKTATSASESASASAQSASQASISASESASASAQSATNASQSATSAQESASNASTSADTATSKATEASTSATKAKESETNAKLSETNASNSAKEAEASAVNAKASETKAEEYANNLQASTDDISQLKEDLVVNSKEDAKTKRSLSALWALNNGISYRFETDSEKAYQKEVPSGAKLGAVNKIGGRTIVYNQLFTELRENINNGVTATYVDNVITLNGTTTQNWFNLKQMTKKMNVIGKFYIKMTILKNDDNVSFYYGWLNRGRFTNAFSKGSQSVIFVQLEDSTKLGLSTGFSGFDIGTKLNDVKVKIMIVNLTQMFGTGNEPSTPEEFEAMFPNDYYPYNEGELMSMSVNEVVNHGKNYFDFSKLVSDGTFTIDYEKQTITVPSKTNNVGYNQTLKDICPNIKEGTYSISMDNSNAEAKKVIHFLETDKDMSISASIELTNADINSHVLFYNNADSSNENVISEIQIEKSSTATTYSPYHVNSYPIPQAIQNLEGYCWSVGTAYNYVDFENKKYYKCVGRVDLGTVGFYQYSDVSFVGKMQVIEGFKNTNNSTIAPNFLCTKYEAKPQAEVWGHKDVTGISASTSVNTYIYINDTSFSDINSFKKSLQGVYLYYELAEPVVTDISDIIDDTFQEPFKVESGGSLTFKNVNGDGYQVAVPSDIQYTVKLSEVNS